MAKLQKRNNRQTIKEKMTKTFGYWRQEIVHKKPNIEDILERWPALFQMEEISAEFMRITTIPLETKFLAQLDKYSPQLLRVIRSKGGVVKEKATRTLQVLDETADINIRRECILKLVMIYLGEPVDHLIKKFQESEAEELEQTTMAIFTVEKEDPFHQPKDLRIIIEGTAVLNELPSVATAFAMFFGLVYALNLKYPKKAQFTFEFVQKVLMALDGKKMSLRIHRLSTFLHSSE